MLRVISIGSRQEINQIREGWGADVQGQENEGLVRLLAAARYAGRGFEEAGVQVVVLGGEDEGREPPVFDVSCCCLGTECERHTGMRRQRR